MGIQAFTPLGNTVTFTAAATAPTPVQAIGSTMGPNQYRIINTGSVTVFLGVGTASANATSNATVTTSMNKAIPLLPNGNDILTFQPNAYFTGVISTDSGSAIVYITPGDGL
jgi:protein-disulfide isomerase